MKKNKDKLFPAFVVLISVFLTACLLSGTFIISSEISFSTFSGFYFYDVDVTNEPDWQDHKDEIDDIEMVGFDLWFTNNSSTGITFNIYLDESTDPIYNSGSLVVDVSNVKANATIVLDDVTLPSGSSHLTYVESLSKIRNFDALKELFKSGKFHFYGIGSDTTGTTWIIDSGKVIVTFSASN